MDLNYYNTFILVAPDCAATVAKIPTAKAGPKTVALLQYELLMNHPYRYTQEDILFEVHLQRLDLPVEEKATRRAELRTQFFAKPQACLRASPLPKTHGWGIHFDTAGRAALFARESPEYARFAATASGELKVLPAMRSKRV